MLQNTMIVSDDDDVEDQGPSPDATKSREAKKLKIKRDIPPVVTLASSSVEEEDSIR